MNRQLVNKSDLYRLILAQLERDGYTEAALALSKVNLLNFVFKNLKKFFNSFFFFFTLFYFFILFDSIYKKDCLVPLEKSSTDEADFIVKTKKKNRKTQRTSSVAIVELFHFFV